MPDPALPPPPPQAEIVSVLPFQRQRVVVRSSLQSSFPLRLKRSHDGTPLGRSFTHPVRIRLTEPRSDSTSAAPSTAYSFGVAAPATCQQTATTVSTLTADTFVAPKSRATPAPPPDRPAYDRSLVPSRSDKLGKHIASHIEIVRAHGLDHLLRTLVGSGDWGGLQLTRQHAAHRLLRQYKHKGTPVTLAGSPWTPQRLRSAIARGPHKSSFEHLDFLRDDMADMVDKGFWTVLPYDLVAATPGLRLSPIGVVPQRNRRPRPIVDYTYSGVNQVTQPNAPQDAMQFGRTLERVLRKILLADPAKGRVFLIKVDLADGYYRMQIDPHSSPKLAVVFPHLPGEPQLVAIPTRIPMGWKNSPPLFCAATETVTDVANRLLLRNAKAAPHRLDHWAASRPATRQINPAADPRSAVPVPLSPDPHLNPHRRRRLHYVDVYIDDFIAAAQGSKPTRDNVRRVLLHAIDDVFRPLDAHDHPSRKEPISVKKLKLGDAAWSTEKEILGWLINTESMTLRMTKHRHRRLYQLLHDDLPRTRKRITVKDFQRALGELRSLALALPGARGLFSTLQETLSQQLPDNRIRLNETLHSILDDFRTLLADIHSRPTRIPELVPLVPTLHGCHDAAGHGAGGVLFPTDLAVSRTQTNSAHSSLAPIVWRMPFPKTVTQTLITHNNRQGTLTNTDLELVGSILQSEAAVQCFDVRERTHLQRTDNLGTLFWQRKGSTTTVKPAAKLLRFQAFHQRFHRHVTIHDYIPGDTNRAADDASRLQSLSNADFLHHFNSTYPQKQSWQLWTPPPAMRSWLTSVLLNTPSAVALPLRVPPPPTHIGKFGPTSAPNWPSTHSYKTSPTLSSSSKLSSNDTALATLHLSATPSEHAPLRMPYVRLGKRSLQWGPKTHASRPPATWISASHASSSSTASKIPRRPA